MKKSTSMRTQTFLLMALLVFLQSLALLFSISVSKVFSTLDAEAFRLFDNTTSARAQDFNAKVGSMISSLSTEAIQLAVRLEALSTKEGQNPTALYKNNELYQQAALTSADSLLNILGKNNVTGAFVIFSGSNSDKTNLMAHSALYIRTTTPESGMPENGSLLMEVGPSIVAKKNQISLSANWDLDLSFNPDTPERYNFYTQPIWASEQFKETEIQRYGYWSPPVAPLRDGIPVVCYSQPLLAQDGTVLGVVGLEISLAYFMHHYLPNTDLPYQSSFYSAARVQDGEINLDWFIPSGPMAQIYLEQGARLSLREVHSSKDITETEVPQLGGMYCSTQQLEMYSRNSPFYDEEWALIGFVIKDVLHETSISVQWILYASILITTTVSFFAIFLLTYLFTRPIRGLSRHISTLNPYEEAVFQRTGLQEIDELTNAIELLNRSVINSGKITAKIMELTSMPIGCFETAESASYVILTDYIYTLIGREANELIGLSEWDDIYAKMTQQIEEEHEDVYHYHHPVTGAGMWLRIHEADTPTGHVGIILDVSSDIEATRRLLYELDYDTLTGLYSRTAFKREADALIAASPNSVGALIFSDLDNLKYVNDNFGHDVGDSLLIRAGEMFGQFVALDGIVSRISGDEFAVYLHGYDSIDEARKAICAQMQKNNSYTLTTPNGMSQRIRSSSGIAWYPRDAMDVDALLKLSDYAMYEAKHKRKGTMFEFSRASYKANSYLLENREAINRLIDEKLVRFAFQPIVELRTGEVYGFEALMRPLLSAFKSPVEVLAVANAQSKLGQLDRMLVMQAFSFVNDNILSIGAKHIFINSIPSQTMTEDDLLFLQRQYGSLFKNIVIEVTEDDSTSTEILQQKVRDFKKLGLPLAVDDFGSGYSNELRILSMNPDIIKVDMNIIQGIHIDNDKRTLVQNILSFCVQKGIRTLAEGVEAPEDLNEVIALGFDYVQGFYTATPAFELLDIDPRTKKEIRTLWAKHHPDT